MWEMELETDRVAQAVLGDVEVEGLTISRNGTDQFRVLFDGTEQRWNGKISALVCVCTFMQERQGFRSVCYSLDYIRGC